VSTLEIDTWHYIKKLKIFKNELKNNNIKNNNNNNKIEKIEKTRGG
jgi:hypothetical protein